MDGGDFGSLSAFLHGGAPPAPSRLPGKVGHLGGLNGGSLGAALGLGVPLPLRPAQPRKASVDGTMLNKKVAFKMLKQLGCEVRGGGLDGSEPFIEVSRIGQPVLFNMLLDFGYEPAAAEDGSPMIRVVDRGRRSQEEVVASLSRPRHHPKGDASEGFGGEADGWPVSAPKPRLRPEQEQEMLSRLAAPRLLKQPSGESAQQQQQHTVAGTLPAGKEQPRFRSKTDQQAHLERLLKPRGAPVEELPPVVPSSYSGGAGGSEEGPLDSTLWPPSMSKPPVGPRGLIFPSFGSGTKSLGRRQAASASPSPGRHDMLDASTVTPSSCSRAGVPPVRPSPRLAQAGLASLTHASSSSSLTASRRGGSASSSEVGGTSCVASQASSPTESRRASSAPLPCCGPSAASPGPGEATPTSPSGSAAAAACPAPAAGDADVAAAAAAAGGDTLEALEAALQEERSKPRKEEDKDWLDKLLGPPSWPGRAAPGERSKEERAEQKERLERLAKPRQKKKGVQEGGDFPTEESEAPTERTVRSPRSQRDACSRLAVPRKHQSQKKQTGSDVDSATGDQALDFNAYSMMLSPSSNAALVAGLTGGGTPGAGGETAEEEALEGDEEADDGDGDVVLIPSALSNGRLSRIDEEPNSPGAGAGAASGRRGGLGVVGRRRKAIRAQSLPTAGGSSSSSSSSAPAVLAPYAAPVVPVIAERMRSGAARYGGGAAEAARRGRKAVGTSTASDTAAIAAARGARRGAWQTPPPGEEQWEDVDAGIESEDAPCGVQFEDDDAPGNGSWGGQAMLDNIDRLYSQLLEREGGGPDPKLRPSASSSSIAAAEALGQEAEEEEEEDEAGLLANIDRLYSEALLQGGGRSEAACRLGTPAVPHTEDEDVRLGTPAWDPEHGRPFGTPPLEGAGSEEGEQPQEEEDEEVVDEEEAVAPDVLRELLTETLWSALMMTRGAKGRLDVQVGLLSMLEPEVLCDCFRVAGLTSLPGSLSQRLAMELPGLSSALDAAAAAAASSSSTGLGSGTLAARLRHVRDYILALACSSEISTEALTCSSVPTPGGAAFSSSAAGHPCSGGAARKAAGAGRSALPPRLPGGGGGGGGGGAGLAPLGDEVCDAAASSAAAAACTSGAGTACSTPSCRSVTSGSTRLGSRRKKFEADKRAARSSLSYWTAGDLDEE